MYFERLQEKAQGSPEGSIFVRNALVPVFSDRNHLIADSHPAPVKAKMIRLCKIISRVSERRARNGVLNVDEFVILAPAVYGSIDQCRRRRN